MKEKARAVSHRIKAMSYLAAIESLNALGLELPSAPVIRDVTSGAAPVPVRRKFELEHMRLLAAELGAPEQAFRSVLIAGTNGKGSTAATLASILRAGGHRVGLYTSPHLSRVNERIQIDGVQISDDDFARLYFRVDEAGAKLVADGKLPQPPSFFETITALAFLYFAEQQVDLAVLEVGLGGRLDATNIVEPLMSIITDISLDHTDWLGSTLAEIAREKAGTLRKNGVLVTLSQHPEANQVLGEVAMELDVTGVNAAEYLPQQSGVAWGEPYALTVLGQPVEIIPALAGSHQHRNVALAIAAAVELAIRHGYKLTAVAVAAGVHATRWPGRLERFSLGPQLAEVWIDVAHNPAGAWTLRSALNSEKETEQKEVHRPATLVFGCMKDKAYAEMAQILFPVFNQVIVAPIDSPRSALVGDLLRVADQLGTSTNAAEDVVDALLQALRQTPPEGRVVCAGSIYLAGPLRLWLLEQQILLNNRKESSCSASPERDPV